MTNPVSYPVEIHHTAGATTVVALLPGVTPSRLKVDPKPDRLVIEAEAPEGSKRIVLPLATPVELDGATMRFEQGVLVVVLPNATH
jgi:HSP20 family molecular chaperone IbpA